MSSHHFVREGQEPALFILDDTSFAQIEGLLEWAPLIIVSDRMLEKVLSWGIRIDAVVAMKEHFDDIVSRLNEVQAVSMIPVSAEKNHLKSAVQFLADRGQKDVNIIAHSFNDNWHAAGLAFPEVRICIFENGRRWLYSLAEFRKWVPKGSIFHLWSGSSDAVTLTGLRSIKEGMYIAESDGIVSILSPSPIWIAENQNL
jgi:hypothetical protein